MEISFVVKGIEVPSELHDYMVQKLSKMEKYFNRITDGKIVAKSIRNNFIVEITANVNGVLMRGEEKDIDLRKAFDLGLKNLERRILRHKEYLVDRAHLKTHDIDFSGLEPEHAETEQPAKIVKVKHFELTPMTAEEAAMQMDLLGHTFFMFIDVTSGKISVIYKRNDGGYGMLVPKV